MAHGEPPAWRFWQVFGEEQASRAEEIQDADLLSAMDYDDSGNYLATGDRGGRVVVFERTSANGDSPNCSPCGTERKMKRLSQAPANAQYRFLTEFQSHEPEFDYLKSMEIEEKINSLKWCKGSMGCKMLLTTNDKTIKLWKIYGKKIKAVSNMNLEAPPLATGGALNTSFGSNSSISSASSRSSRSSSERGSTPDSPDAPTASTGLPEGLPARNLRLPLMSTCERVVTATPKRTFANAHSYHINSLALNSDGETFMSCDDLRLNLWNLRRSTTCFNLVDAKPASMETLSEVITSAEFHPTHCQNFLFSSSRGCVRVGDMRCNALCDRQAKLFEAPEEGEKSFFHEITSSISNARFSKCGRYIAARDYMCVRLWDVNMESKPLKTFHVHEHLRSKLCDLYKNDSIFDKFDVSFSHDSQHIVTGSYQNNFHVLSVDGSKPDEVVEARKSSNAGRRYDAAAPKMLKSGSDGTTEGAPPSADGIDFSKRALHCAFHPVEDTIGIAATSALYIFRS